MDTFQQLQEEYPGRTATLAAVVRSRTAMTVDVIRFNQVIDKLRPSPMYESDRGVCLLNTRLDTVKMIRGVHRNPSTVVCTGPSIRVRTRPVGSSR
ncbi:hypothetical protein FIBSPDRAFT_879004 [Athelia psychrophila]|uniref:Uncharacterized protein n=1 Tax=Athelia psychrophila TaxID=1759441 RepID=A0A167UG87_9AGAM|nr:hypothetical protein FIBSPDRAFT_879004 [Fibularhizoctonia sp. CBS 109695]